MNEPTRGPLVVRSLLATWLALLALAALTVASAFVHLGGFNTLANLAIAAAKATLVMLVFMRLSKSGALIRVFAFGVFFWIATMLALSLLDFATRPR